MLRSAHAEIHACVGAMDALAYLIDGCVCVRVCAGSDPRLCADGRARAEHPSTCVRLLPHHRRRGAAIPLARCVHDPPCFYWRSMHVCKIAYVVYARSSDLLHMCPYHARSCLRAKITEQIVKTDLGCVCVCAFVCGYAAAGTAAVPSAGHWSERGRYQQNGAL
eukprot:COSAG05_NODE_2929_length_2495_cov_1.626461_1_plen_164_part_00